MSTAKRPKYRGRFSGTFPSLKAGKIVPYVGITSRELLYFLEYDSTVLSYEAQPFPIARDSKKGKPKHYWPDYLVVRQCSQQLVKCIPVRYLPLASVQEEREVIQEWANCNGYDFVIITDEKLRAGRRLDNLQLLWRYARVSIPPGYISRCNEYFKQVRTSVPLDELVKCMSDPEDSLKQKHLIYALLFRHVLDTDLDQVITTDSKVWPSTWQ